MNIHVRLFAVYRDAAGRGDLEVPATAGLTVAALWNQLRGSFPALSDYPPSAAVNRVWATAETPVGAGDEVSFLPPVSGG